MQEDIIQENKEHETMQDAVESACEKALREKTNEYLYIRAELENANRRAARDQERAISLIKGKMLDDIMVLADDLDRLSADVSHPAVAMMIKNMQQFFTRQGVTVISAEGLFDPELHEAIAQIPAPSPELIDTIASVSQKGYRTSTIILRPARVVVYH